MYTHINPFTFISILVNVIFVTIFIGIFFFTYGKIVEQQIVKSHAEFIAKELSKDVKLLIPSNVSAGFVDKLIPPNMDSEDAIARKNNSDLLSTSIKVLGSIFIIGMGFVFWYSKKYNLPLKIILIRNIVLLLGVALTEFIFLTIITKNYISFDPNYIKHKILLILKDNFGSSNQYTQYTQYTQLIPALIQNNDLFFNVETAVESK